MRIDTRTKRVEIVYKGPRGKMPMDLAMTQGYGEAGRASSFVELRGRTSYSRSPIRMVVRAVASFHCHGRGGVQRGG